MLVWFGMGSFWLAWIRLDVDGIWDELGRARLGQFGMGSFRLRWIRLDSIGSDWIRLRLGWDRMCLNRMGSEGMRWDWDGWGWAVPEGKKWVPTDTKASNFIPSRFHFPRCPLPPGVSTGAPRRRSYSRSLPGRPDENPTPPSLALGKRARGSWG